MIGGRAGDWYGKKAAQVFRAMRAVEITEAAAVVRADRSGFEVMTPPDTARDVFRSRDSYNHFHSRKNEPLVAYAHHRSTDR